MKKKQIKAKHGFTYYEKSRSGNKAGAARVHVYKAKQSHEETIFTQTAAILLFKCRKSLSGLK